MAVIANVVKMDSDGSSRISPNRSTPAVVGEKSFRLQTTDKIGGLASYVEICAAAIFEDLKDKMKANDDYLRHMPQPVSDSRLEKRSSAHV